MKIPPVPPQHEGGEADRAEKESGPRRQVRDRLIERLADAGMKRAKSMTVEAHAGMTERLVDRLAYMTPRGLDLLAECVMQAAEGKGRNLWPAEATVINLARRIERPPPRSDRIVTSYMRSAAGRRAWEEDPLIAAALYRHLAATRLPPADFQWDRFREDAELRRMKIRGARQRREEGRETDDDVRRLSEWAAEREQVQALVFEKEGDRHDEPRQADEHAA